MGYINYRKNNPIYSPGLTTYTGTVDKGENGENGTKIYYANRTLSQNNNISLFNSMIDERVSFSSDDTVEYNVGDIIIDDIGNVYIIEANETDKTKLQINNTPIGNIITNENAAFYIDGSIFKMYEHDSGGYNDTYTFQGADSSINIINDLTNIVNNANLNTNNPQYIQQINKNTGEVTLWKVDIQ